LGKKVMADTGLAAGELAVQQWEAYADETGGGPASVVVLAALLTWMERRGVDELVTTTQLLITPGYGWHVVSGLVTNFHQPESTLLLLVASLIGNDWRKLYGYALEHGFRFLSYGDGCLLLPGSIRRP
jgi:S-adenosylmethionine:tRNA ribosyltransferase-isomerase